MRACVSRVGGVVRLPTRGFRATGIGGGVLDVTVPVAGARRVVVHYHIFKNGGSTIEYILERVFPGRFAALDGADPDAVLDAEDLTAFLDQYPGVAAVSSHHLRYPKPVSRRTVLFDCCFLRDPLARLYSSYNHFRRCDPESPYSRWARTYSAREFAKRLIDEAPHLASNVQVTQLANAGAFTRPANEQDLERASAVLREMAVPGLVEMFDESLVAAEHFLRPAFPGLRLEYIAQNVSQAGARAPDDAREYWESLWGRELHGLLRRMNEMDLELVRRARQEIERRLSQVPRAEEKLRDLRARCERLAAAFGGQAAEPRAPAEGARAVRSAAGG